MALSAAFTINGTAVPASVSVAYGATVNLALTSLSAVHTIEWTIPGTSKSTQSAPTVTPAGVPIGATASFAVPSDPGDGLGRSFLVKCVVRDRDGKSSVAYGVVGALNSRGLLPVAAGEELARHATHGWTDVANSAINGGVGAIQLHDTTHSPVVLYQFDETLNDTSGNALHFSVLSGTERYTEIYPGVRAVQLTATILQRASNALFQLTGDMTIEMLLNLQEYNAAARVLISCGANGETEATNALYTINLLGGGTLFEWFHEHGAGVNDVYSLSAPVRWPPLGLCHLAVTRSSNVIQFYINGRTFGPASGALTAASGGTTGLLRTGDVTGAVTPPNCAIASLKIVPSALTANQIKAEYNRTLGPAFGTVS